MNNVKITIDYPCFNVVADGGVSIAGLGEGRFIPAIIIDIKDKIEIEELLKLHDTTPPGDTELFWSLPPTFFSKPKSVLLSITFVRPMKLSFGIEFSLPQRYALVDGIIQARAFQLQVGKIGDKISTLFTDKAKRESSGSILIEVPFMKFDAKWNELLFDNVKDIYRKKGASRKDATRLANDQIKKMRELWNFRPKNDL
jgi:hypothetical protein